MAKSLARRSPQWTTIPERGSVLGILVFLWTVRLGGRRLARIVLWPVMVYFFLSSRLARQASRSFLRRVGHPAGAREVFAHLLRFGQVALDRMLFVKRATSSLRFGLGPTELFEELRTSRGALLLGAHVGSFEAMAGIARDHALRVSAVVDTSNSRMLMSVLERLDPTLTERLIDLGKGRLAAIFEIRQRLERGEHVGLLADRCSADERSVAVPFMGQDARFPAGPYVLAATLQCPIYFVAALYRGGDRYDIHIERFADRVTLSRSDRDAALRKWVALYAERLEALARREPMNWFNFYDFWHLGG